MTKTIYVDSAASALKPESVFRAQSYFLKNGYANAGRGVCARAVAIDDMVAKARADTTEFIGAKGKDQVVFTNGTTDGLNRIARILDLSGMIGVDSTVMVSDLDHHSARLPFEELAYLGKCKLSVVPLDDGFNIDITKIGRADIFVVTAMSNVMGMPHKVKKIIAKAKKINPDVITVVDAAQYVVHLPMNVSDWDCDFLCFSGHKIGADTGVGIMYIKELTRWQTDKLGGGMVANVAERHLQSMGHKAKSKNNATSEWTLSHGAAKFEAGTLPLTQIVGLIEAIKIRTQASDDNESEIRRYLRAELSNIPRIRFISPDGAYILTFIVDGMHPLDFGALVGARCVCLRVGNMCASWIHARLGVSGTIRISVGPWNTMQEAGRLASIIKDIIK